MKKYKRVKNKKQEPGIIYSYSFDGKKYYPEETAFLWARLFQELTQLENKKPQTI